MGVKFAEPTAIQYAKALYDFNAGKKVELSLKKSDVVKIFHLDGEWCYGELNGVKGFFPHNFVKNIDEEEYNKLIKNSINNEGSMLINNISDDINEKKTKDNEDSRNNEEDENNEKDKDNKNNEKDENSEKDEDDRLKELEKQIRNSTLRKGVSNRTSTDGKRSWYNAYQGSIRYVSKNESILAMKENGPNAEKNNISMRNSSEKLSNHDMVKSKSGSSLLGNNVKSNQKVDFGFINGPAKLKMKWIDFIGGKEVADEMGLSKKDIKRQEVIYEMIDTERDYVNDLSIIIELYIKPMRNNNILSKKDLGTLFSNIEQLYGVNQELLSLFEERQKQNKCVEEIGDIWLMMNEYLKMYMLYCGNYAYAITKLEDLKSSKSISKFLNNQFHKKESRSLKLESFLIKPVQRICKYPLLLRELIKFTDESCKDYKNLINAYSKLETVVTVVNGASKEAEAAHYLIAFQSRFNPKISIVSPSRRLKYKCEVSVYMKKLSSPTQSLSSILSSGHSHNFEKKKRLLFIFDDLIIIAKSLSQGTDKLTKGKLKLIQKSEYSNLEVKSFKNSEENNLINAIEITFSNPDILTIIFCEDDEAKSEILSHLTDCIREYQSINKNESGPNIVKRLPSEKVYSMISNKSQDLIEEEEENNITSTTSEEKETNKVEINSKEEEERIIIIPENKSDEYKNGENLDCDKEFKYEAESSPKSFDDNSSDFDQISPLKNQEIATIVSNYNLCSCSSIESINDINIPQEESTESELIEESGENQDGINEVIKLLDTFISNSNESLDAYINNNDNDESIETPMHERESSVIIREEEEDVPPILEFKNKHIISSFKPSIKRYDQRSEKISSKISKSPLHNEAKSVIEIKESVEKTPESDIVSNERKSIMNRISFYENINLNNKDNYDDNEEKGSQISLSEEYPIRNAIVNNVICKMKNAKKYYVYEIIVNLNNDVSKTIPSLKEQAGKSIKVYHTYEEFFDFHFQFIEANIANRNNKNNIAINQIPTLPSQIQYINDRIAQKRIFGLQTYINGILNLSTSITSSDIIYIFLSSSGFDSLKLMEN